MSEHPNRVNDAFQAARSLEAMQKEKASLTETIFAAEQLLDDIRSNKELNSIQLDYLEMGSSTGYSLRIKLRGLLSVKKNRLEKIMSSMKQDIEILKQISICPYCAGSGEKLDHGYERFGRRIHTTVSFESCGYCNGSGKIHLSEDVIKIIKNALDLVRNS